MYSIDGTFDVHAWIEEETKPVDVVASWESLCETYDALRFSDPLTDSERLGEFKWIIQQMNSFMTKIRSNLMSCKNIEAMIEMLGSKMIPAGMDLSERKSLVFQKLRQQWMRTMIARLQTILDSQREMEKELEMMKEGEMDGWQS